MDKEALARFCPEKELGRRINLQHEYFTGLDKN